MGITVNKHDAIGKKAEYCEDKPKNVNTNDPSPKKLNGGENFTDYTWARLAKNEKDNPTMLIAGFIDGRLIYIFRFPFESEGFVDRIKHQLKNKFPDGDRSGFFLRSASFGLNHYKDISNLDAEVFVNREELLEYKPHITKGLYHFIEKHILLRQ